MNRDLFFERIENNNLSSKKLLDGAGALCYGDVLKRCRQLNAFWKDCGLKPGDRIGIASRNEPESFALILSCLRLGYPIVMIDAAAKQTEAADIIRRTELRGLFLDEELMQNWFPTTGSPSPLLWPITKQKKKLISRLLTKKTSEPDETQAYPECLNAYQNVDSLPAFEQEDRVALLLCTSGTTGTPKILQLSYSNLAAAAKTTSSCLRFDSEMRVLNLLPLTHYDGIISGLFTTFWNAGTQIRLGTFAVSLLPEIFDAVYKYRATHLLLTPSILSLMLRLGEEMEEVFRSDDFQFVISVAATLPPKLWSEFQTRTGKKVVNVYGLSETGNNLFAGPDEASYKIGSIGKPVDCSAIIRNGNGGKAATGEQGELLLNGASITKGYLGAPINQSTVEGGNWFPTGDLAYCDEDGVFWLVGRKKNVMIVGGRNVYPDEINNVLLSHPGVLEAATVALPDEIWGDRVVSCVVGHPDVTSQKMMDYATKHLSDYKVPREIHIVSELPKGRSGKVLTNELIEQLSQGKIKTGDGNLEKLEARILHLASESFRVPMQELSLKTAPQNCSRWDSVAHMDFVVNVESKFGIELLPREVIRITTLEAAVQLVREKLA